RGFRGLYARFAPTLVEIIPYAGLQFVTYDIFKPWTLRLNRLRSSNQAVCYPLHVVKKRFQIIGLPRNPKYGARLSTMLYKGIAPSVI
ncbi:hypothetical protein MKW98_031538, partial [Papaver atlanticum]